MRSELVCLERREAVRPAREERCPDTVLVHAPFLVSQARVIEPGCRPVVGHEDDKRVVGDILCLQMV